MRQPTEAEIERERQALENFTRSIAGVSKEHLRRQCLALFSQLRDVYWKYEALRNSTTDSWLLNAVRARGSKMLEQRLGWLTKAQRDKLRNGLAGWAKADKR